MDEQALDRVARTIFEGVAEAGRWEDQPPRVRERYRKTAEGVILAMDDTRVEGLREAVRIAENFAASARRMAVGSAPSERLANLVETARSIADAIRRRADAGQLGDRS